jgi:hypothetical protein
VSALKPIVWSHDALARMSESAGRLGWIPAGIVALVVAAIALAGQVGHGRRATVLGWCSLAVVVVAGLKVEEHQLTTVWPALMHGAAPSALMAAVGLPLGRGRRAVLGACGVMGAASFWPVLYLVGGTTLTSAAAVLLIVAGLLVVATSRRRAARRRPDAMSQPVTSLSGPVGGRVDESRRARS